jgi:hypothetical protein
MSETLDNNASTGQRPVFLTVLCILSFIASGIGIIGVLTLTLFAGAVEVGVSAAAENGADVSEVSTGGMWIYLILALGLIVVSLVGVIKMWKLKKQGFMLYTGAAIAGIIIEVILGAGFNFVSVLFTGAFIAMYAANLKHMN